VLAAERRNTWLLPGHRPPPILGGLHCRPHFDFSSVSSSSSFPVFCLSLTICSCSPCDSSLTRRIATRRMGKMAATGRCRQPPKSSTLPPSPHLPVDRRLPWSFTHRQVPRATSHVIWCPPNRRSPATCLPGTSPPQPVRSHVAVTLPPHPRTNIENKVFATVQSDPGSQPLYIF
jgi:hypothetical protein